MMELMFMQLVMIALLAGFAWADVAVRAMQTTMRKPRYEPHFDVPPVTARRNPWFSIWA